MSSGSVARRRWRTYGRCFRPGAGLRGAPCSRCSRGSRRRAGSAATKRAHAFRYKASGAAGGDPGNSCSPAGRHGVRRIGRGAVPGAVARPRNLEGRSPQDQEDDRSRGGQEMMSLLVHLDPGLAVTRAILGAVVAIVGRDLAGCSAGSRRAPPACRSAARTLAGRPGLGLVRVRSRPQSQTVRGLCSWLVSLPLAATAEAAAVDGAAADCRGGRLAAAIQSRLRRNSECRRW